VSGYLERLALRSLGSPAAASAHPRLPGRFESPAGGGAGLEVAGEQPATPGARQPGTPGAPQPVPAAPVPAHTGRRPAERAAEPRPSAARTRIPHAAAHPAAAGPQAARVASPPALPADPRPRAPDAPGAAEAPAQAPAVAPAVAAPVPAVPVARTRPVVPPHSDSQVAAAAAAPVVRVHIGRLEVRANLQPAAVAPAARPEPARDELALAAYLRGECGAR